jgi:hypothetical protein
MDPLRLCLALGPIAVYLVLLGMMNLGKRPFLVSGTRDAAALGLAVSGFIIIGPLSLLFPDAAAAHLGPSGPWYVWAVLLALYGLCLVWVLLTLRPRLVIYNISADQLRPILADLVERLDPEARWAGDSLVLPALGVQLHVEGVAWMRNVALVSAGLHQDHQGWRRLESSLAGALGQIEVRRNPGGLILLSIGVVIVGILIGAIAHDPQAVGRALMDMLQQ